MNILGDLYRDMGDVSTARDYHTRSLALAREQNNRGSQCDNLRDLGADCLLQGETGQALSYLDEVLALSRTHGYTWYETRSYITFAELHLARGDVDRAEDFARRGVEMARTLKARELIVEAQWKMALVLHRSGRQEDASALLRDAIEIAESSGHETFLWQLYRDMASILASSPRKDEASLAESKAAELQTRIAEGFKDPHARKLFVEWSRSAGRPDPSAQKNQESP